MNILVLDVGGTHVKMRVNSSDEIRKFDSGKELSPDSMIRHVLEVVKDWEFTHVTVGYPGLVVHGRIAAEPANLGPGWVGFDFSVAFGRPVKLLNDAAMQALGSYKTGTMLFLGLGTGLGSAMVSDGVLQPMELAHLPFKKGKTYEEYLGVDALERSGHKKWESHVWEAVDLLRKALEPDLVVIGGGNSARLSEPPRGVEIGQNSNAFLGGFRVWDSLAKTQTKQETSMQIAMVGLGRMGANMVRKLMASGHECVAYDRSAEVVAKLQSEGANGVASLEEMVSALAAPRAVWLMVPSALVDGVIGDLAPLLSPGDTIIDGGNSYYIDDIRRAKALMADKIHYVDVGTSGGVFGLERGYCQMIGGEKDVVHRLEPIFAALAPPTDSAPPTPGRDDSRSTAAQGFLHCGPAGAGHFVKMVHNGIEYGVMAAYAEGLNLLHHANIGHVGREADAETTPLRNPEHFQYDIDVPEVAEVWRRGSVIASWLLDLTASALAEDPKLKQFEGRVSDSGEGRWTVNAAIEASVPAPVLSAALFQRFSSRGESDYADKILSAMRSQFGGHHEKS